MGGALYLKELLGAEVTGNTITNIFGKNDLNIYYLASLEGNSYLDGQSYNLSGGGQLIAMKTPIPGAVWLLTAGLFCIAGARRKFER